MKLSLTENNKKLKENNPVIITSENINLLLKE